MTTSSLPFHGTFHTTVSGTQSAMQLEQSGQQVTGKIDGAIVKGTADGNAARGDLIDPQSNQVGGTFEMNRRGDALELTITLRDPQSGQTLAVPAITFTAGEPPPVDARLDPRAVGRWRHTWAQASGGFSVAIDTWMTLAADGTFEYGESKMGGGGPDSSFTGERGGNERGRWRAEAGVIYVADAPKDAPWQRLAKYYVEGDTMMFTYDNGGKKIWERQ